MTGGGESPAGSGEPFDAEGWFARMRGPDADQWSDRLAMWRAERPENDADYCRLLQRWEQTAFLTNSKIVRARNLSRASSWSRRPAIRYAAIAASAVLIMGSGVLAMHRFGIFERSPVALEYASVDRKVRALVLSDGTRITLDAGAAIKVAQISEAREVTLLVGRARFDRAAPGEHPLIVTARGGSIVADNAQFDVDVADTIVKVVAWRGALDLSGSGMRPVRVASGQQFSFDAVRGTSVLTRAHPGEIEWTRGMLSFERTRLAEAVAAINRYALVTVQLETPEIGELRLTGAFRSADPRGFADAVAEMFGLTLKEMPDGAILLARDKKT